MKRLIFAGILIASLASAGAFNASIETVKQVADQDSPAEFRFTVQNNDVVNHSYSISLLTPKSSWFYYPSTVRVPPGQNRSFTMTVSPVRNAIQQRYTFDMKIRESRTGELKQLSGNFRVEQPYRIQIVDLEKNREDFKPGEVIESQITIRNLDNRPIEDYRIEATYEDINRSETGTRILPGAERQYEFSFRVKKNSSPGERQIDYRVMVGGREERIISHKISVLGVKNISKTESSENRIISKTVSKKVTNSGNSPANASITAEIPSYLSSITEVDPEPVSSQEVEGKTVFTWRKTLQSGESFSISYTIRYWIPALAVTVILLGLVALKSLGGGIKMTKKVEETGQELKVNIEIRNKGGKTYESLELREFIPDIAEVEGKFDMNVPQVRETSEGTKLTWKVENLEPGDQRIIQYSIKPKLKVEEKVELQPAVLEDKDGKKYAETNKAEARFGPNTS